MSNLDSDWMNRLRTILPNWDDEGAPVPSEDSINRSKEIVDWAILNNINIEDIDPDVLGGVAIYLNGIYNRRAWISILNYSLPTIAIREDVKRRVVGCILNEESLESLKSFLTTEDLG